MKKPSKKKWDNFYMKRRRKTDDFANYCANLIMELNIMTNNDEKHLTNIEKDDTLTNRQGHPVTDNQNIRTVGNRGPALLENYDFIEKISHFDREKFRSASFMHGVPEPTVTLKLTAPSETSPLQSIQERNCSRKKEKERLYSSVSQRLCTDSTPRRPFGTQEVLR